MYGCAGRLTAENGGFRPPRAVHWKITANVQSAVAINGMVGAIVNSAVSWSGNYWRERVGGRQICLGFVPFRSRLGPPRRELILLLGAQ